ncbi:MAG: dihydroorotase [Chloroflexi bacterium]|nr:MAG: dihydroorotase [Chloroflexota bacterium]
MSGSDRSAIDVLIRGARVCDGSGNPWFYGDVALSGERVMDVTPPGQVSDSAVAELVDGTGMIVCPGFIDIQSHSIVPLMIDGRCLSKITQGVTTEIMGEAWTPAPFGGRIEDPFGDAPTTLDVATWGERARGWSRFGDWLKAMVVHGVSPNIGSFLGGGTLREYARGMDMGRSSTDELDLMRRVMIEAMEDGAFGVSYALIYPPDTFAGTDEIVAVCEVVAGYGGVYITHLRSESGGLLEAVDEALEIGRRAGLPVEIYHLKASGRSNWGKMPVVIDRIERARAHGQDVTADMYPYVGSGTGLSSLLPPWVAEGGKFYENLRDPAVRARVREAVLHPSGDWDAFGKDAGPEGVMPIGFVWPEHREYAGKRLSEIAGARGQDWIDTAIDLLVAEGQRIFTVFFSMSEENVGLQMRQPWMKISTDAGGMDPAWATPEGPTHPRAYGTYPRVLGRYVREERVLSLEEAIRKMTSSVANRLGLRDRGLLAPGYFADVVLFDPEIIADRATFDDSHRLSTGIRDVWVNGARVLRGGEHTGVTPGQIVRGPAAH